MVWTQKSELPLIRRVCQEIVHDMATGKGIRIHSTYAELAPSLFRFGKIQLSVSKRWGAPITDLSVMGASASPSIISLTVGGNRSKGQITDAERTLSGILCHELVHQKQGARNPCSMAMATQIQNYWVANEEANAGPHDWIVGYYGTVYEFEAHAEQIAYEIWMTDIVAGQVPRKNVSLAQVTQCEPLERIRRRLQVNAASSLVSDWLSRLEAKVNEALAIW
ncbi:hypothetical protein [Novosphingobium lindaniclasticum]